jgi:hypothetical protein
MIKTIRDLFVDIKGVARRLHLVSKNDSEIKQSTEIIDNTADGLWKRLDEQIRRKESQERAEDDN